jgi:hypothetical protein
MPIPRRTPTVRRRTVPLMLAAIALLCACARHPQPCRHRPLDPHAVEAVLDARSARGMGLRRSRRVHGQLPAALRTR